MFVNKGGGVKSCCGEVGIFVNCLGLGRYLLACPDGDLSSWFHEVS